MLVIATLAATLQAGQQLGLPFWYVSESGIRAACERYFAAKDTLAYQEELFFPNERAAQQKIAFGEPVTKEMRERVKSREVAIHKAQIQMGNAAKQVLVNSGSESHKAFTPNKPMGSSAWLTLGEVNQVCRRYS